MHYLNGPEVIGAEHGKKLMWESCCW